MLATGDCCGEDSGGLEVGADIGELSGGKLGHWLIKDGTD